MTAACPACNKTLKVRNAPTHVGMAICRPCGAKLEFTGGAVPFDPEKHGFSLRLWEDRLRELKGAHHAGIVERLLSRMPIALVLGILTAIIATLVATHFDAEMSLWTPFLIALPPATLIYAIILGQMYAHDKRNLALVMKALTAKMEARGPVIELEEVNA